MSALAHLVAVAALVAAPPREASDVLQTLGVVTHLDYRGTPYENLAQVQTALRYVGIDRLRDMTPHANVRPYEQLAAQGFHFNFVIRSEAAEELPKTVRDLAAFQQRFKGSIVSVEGLNEIKFWPANYHGQTGFPGGVAVQRDLYSLMKHSAVLGKTPVLALTLGGASAADHARLGDVSDFSDLGNAHAYFDGRVPSSSWRFAIDLARRSTSKLAQSAVTETGYSSNPQTPQGVPSDVQAKYLLVLVCEAWRENTPATYLYQLVDDKRDAHDWSRSLGLYDVDWNPKPAAHAFHYLTQGLTSTFITRAAPRAFAYALSGESTDVQSLLLRKSDGNFALIVWREVKLWDEKARQTLVAESRLLSVTASAAHVASIDTFTGERRSLASSHGAYPFVLEDRPLILEFTPQSTQPISREK